MVILIGLASLMVWLVLIGQEGRDRSTRENARVDPPPETAKAERADPAPAARFKRTLLDSQLADWMVVKSDRFQLQALVFHSLFYLGGLHLVGTLAVLFYAGRLLEARWGSPRFAAFFVFVSVTTAALALVVQWCLAHGDDTPLRPSATFGGTGVAVACLAVLAFVDGDVRLFRSISRRHLQWALVLLTATGLIQVESTKAYELANASILLLPQLSGVLFGWLFIRALPFADDMVQQWRQRRQQAEAAKVERIRRRVDQLLAKISREGIDSLCEEERAFLKRASKHYRPHL